MVIFHRRNFGLQVHVRVPPALQDSTILPRLGREGFQECKSYPQAILNRSAPPFTSFCHEDSKIPLLYRLVQQTVRSEDCIASACRYTVPRPSE